MKDKQYRYTLVLLTSLVMPFIISLILFITLGRIEIVFAHRLINVEFILGLIIYTLAKMDRHWITDALWSGLFLTIIEQTLTLHLIENYSQLESIAFMYGIASYIVIGIAAIVIGLRFEINYLMKQLGHF